MHVHNGLALNAAGEMEMDCFKPHTLALVPEKNRSPPLTQCPVAVAVAVVAAASGWCFAATAAVSLLLPSSLPLPLRTHRFGLNVRYLLTQLLGWKNKYIIIKKCCAFFN